MKTVYSAKNAKCFIAERTAKEREMARKRWQRDAKKQGF